tara:strand:+ start:1490 stop:2269 length:780 start_codon:yes stop_codon:yes gene_type:complete
MAINVNTVYQTVLLILNKEQRGYLTPTEFNNIGNQVQLEIFNTYFEDLNQQLRVPQTDTDYADRVENLDEKIAIFKTLGNAIPASTSDGLIPYWVLPSVDIYGNDVSPGSDTPFFRLGSVLYNNETQLQRVDRSDYYHIDRSLLTRPTKTYPVYLYENEKLFVKPTTIDTVGEIQVDFVRKPITPVWGFTVGSLGQYLYNSQALTTNNTTGSVNFELHESEQTKLIIDILMYAGIVIRDPSIVQAAARESAMQEQNEKM